MRVALVFPNPSSTSPQKSPPLAILYVGERAKVDGHEVRYLDERWNTKAEIESAIRWADVVGISTQTGEQLKNAVAISKFAKSVGAYRVMGGVHPTFCAEQLIQEGHTDAVVLGEGEEIFADVLAQIQAKQPLGELGGVAVGSTGGKVVINPRPRFLKGEEIVSPVSEATLPFFIKANKTNDVTLPSSRGCAFSCNFCFNVTFNKSKWRPVPLDHWKEQVLRVHKVSPIRWMQPVDDWMGPKKRVMEVGGFLHSLGIGWKPSIRAHQVDEELAEFLAKNGCTTIALGVETGSPYVLEHIVNKGETLEDIVHAAEALSKYDVQAMYSFMLGFPGETKEQRGESFDFADRLYGIHNGNCLISFYVYAAFPGTPLYNEAIKTGRNVPRNTEEWIRCSFETAGTQEEKNIYHISGINFQRGSRGKTSKNFPGWKRAVFKPLEIACQLRWKHRYFEHFDWEQKMINKALKWAAKSGGKS